MNDNTDEIEALVRRARSMDAEIRELNEAKALVVARIDKLVDVGWKMDVDGVTVRKTAGNRRFDAKLALSMLDPDTKLSCVRTVIDDKLVRAAAQSAGIEDACMTGGDDKSILKLVG